MKQRWLWAAVPPSFACLLLSSNCGDSGSPSGQQASSGSVAGSGSSGATSGIASAGSLGASGMSAGNSAGTNVSAGTSGSAGGASGAMSASGGDGGASSGSQPEPAGSNSVLQRGNHASRDANWVQPKLTKAALMAMKMKPDTAFTATLTGSVSAVPLFLENGPAGAGCPAGAMANGCMAMTRAAGAGLFFAATTGNDVYALDETTGAIVWHKNVGKAPGMGDRGQTGILGTPVIDAGSRTIYVAAGIAAAPVHHEVHALSVDDGTERMGWPVILSATTLTVNGKAFNSPVQNQRGALSFQGGVVYVPYGGFYGDQGMYSGWVVAINTATNPPTVGGWVTQGPREGIWAAGGMASDGTGIFAITGNGNNVSLDHSNTDAEEVVRLTGMGTLNRTAANVYYPTIWKTEGEQGDLDFGANNPVYVPLLPNSTPSALLVAPHKAGRVFFLNANQLGNGVTGPGGGEVAIVDVSAHGAESLYTAPTVYHTPKGIYVAVSTAMGPVCPAGSPAAVKTISSILIQAAGSTAPTPSKTTWCAAASMMNAKQYTLYPISTTSDGMSDAIVWFIYSDNGGLLTAVDGDTGAVLFAETQSTCGKIHNMSSPIAVKGRIVVGADGKLCSWSLQ